MKKKISYEDLLAFCLPDNELYPATQEPRYKNGYWYATNHKYLLRINEEHVKKDRRLKKEFKDGELPNFERVIKNITIERVLNLAELSDALDKMRTVDEIDYNEIETKYEKCPECSGSGVSYTHVSFRGQLIYSSFECPVCKGFGMIPNDEDYDPDLDEPEDFVSYDEYKTGRKVCEENALIMIDGVKFRAIYIDKILQFLLKYGYSEVSCIVKDKLVIDIGIGKILLMPIDSSFDNGEIKVYTHL